MSGQHQYGLGKKVRYQDGRVGRVVDVQDIHQECNCLAMRYYEDGEERELVAATSKFEVVS